MDHNIPPPSWVEQAVIDMRESQDYQKRIVDEWYETLPVPAWNAQQNWLVVGFGKNSRSGGPMGPVQSRAPHIACVLSYPDGKQQWSVDNLTQRVWPAADGATNPALPTQIAGSPMERLRHYYRALSGALEQGAFTAHAPRNAAGACAAARETRDLFLPASPYPNLTQIYAGALGNIDGWLKTNCAKP
jgi:hypothetical protein